MLSALVLASDTIAEELTLIVPLGLMLLTIAWVIWMIRRHNRAE